MKIRKTPQGLKLNMNVTVEGRKVFANLELCNTGKNNITLSNDVILLNDMYSKYPFSFSDNLDSHCETDSSRYKTTKIHVTSDCLHKTWDLTQECDFQNQHDNYTVKFEQVVEYYEDNNTTDLVLGANGSFTLP